VHEGAIVNHLFEQNASAEGDYMVAGSVKYGDTGTDTSFDDAGSGNLDVSIYFLKYYTVKHFTSYDF
jgi:hypothetical protein